MHRTPLQRRTFARSQAKRVRRGFPEWAVLGLNLKVRDDVNTTVLESEEKQKVLNQLKPDHVGRVFLIF